MRKVLQVGVVVLAGMLLAQCSGRETEMAQAPAEREIVTPPSPVEGKLISVPSDPNATFYLLDKAQDNGKSVVITKREGSSGVSYSSRLYDCLDYTVKYLGTGDTRAAMEQSPPDAAMSPIIPGSIASDIAQIACAP